MQDNKREFAKSVYFKSLPKNVQETVIMSADNHLGEEQLKKIADSVMSQFDKN